MHRRPFGDPSETNMPDRRPFVNLQETLRRPIEIKIRIFKCVDIPIRHRRHVGLKWGMSVFNGSPIRHVGLRLGMSVSGWACQSPMKHIDVSNGSLIRHVGQR